MRRSRPDRDRGRSGRDAVRSPATRCSPALSVPRTFAELITLDHVDVAAKTPILSLAEAASTRLVALTARQALVEMADVQPGEPRLHRGRFRRRRDHRHSARRASRCGRRHHGERRQHRPRRGPPCRRHGRLPPSRRHDGPRGLRRRTAQSGRKRDHAAFRVLRPGGRSVSLSAPPDPSFADRIGAPWWLRPVLVAMNAPARLRARQRKGRLPVPLRPGRAPNSPRPPRWSTMARIRPVVDQTFSVDATSEALVAVGSGHSQGKVVITVR